MWSILILFIFFLIVLFIISIINSWLRLSSLRKNARFGINRSIRINSYRVHYVEFGEGRPLILLPDALGDYRTWNLLLPILSQKFRCIGIDWPGTGNSDKPFDFQYTLPVLAEFILDFIDELQIEVANFVGVGLGGTLIYYLAGNFPVNVGRSVAIGSFFNFNPTARLRQQRLLSWLKIPCLGYFVHLVRKSGLMSGTIAKQALGLKWKRLSALERQNFQNDLALGNFQAQWKPTIQLLETWLQNQSPSKSMNRIEVPILQLWGIQSRFPPTIHPTIERLKQFPRVTQWLIQESNHELHWQHPRWVAQVTTHFINEENIFSESGNGGVWEVKVT